MTVVVRKVTRAKWERPEGLAGGRSLPTRFLQRRRAGLAIEAAEGRTPVASLRGRHVNVVRLDVYRLVKVATLVANALERGQHQRLTKKDVVEVVVQAVREGLVALDDLQDNVRAEAQKVLNE